MSEEYATALSEQLHSLQTELSALREDTQTAQSRIQNLEVAKRQVSQLSAMMRVLAMHSALSLSVTATIRLKAD